MPTTEKLQAVPTMEVANKKGHFCRINAEDFDPNLHTPWAEFKGKKGPAKPAAASKKTEE